MGWPVDKYDPVATIGYWLEIHSKPEGGDKTVIVQRVICKGSLVAEQVVGELYTPTDMLNFREFISSGGRVVLGKDLAK